MALDNQPKLVELARWELRIADLERRVAEQKRRVACEAGEGLGAREVLHFMEQTLEYWQEHGRVLRERPWRRNRDRTDAGALNKLSKRCNRQRVNRDFPDISER